MRSIPSCIACILSWLHIFLECWCKTAVVWQRYALFAHENRCAFLSEAVGCQQDSFRLPIMISSVRHLHDMNIEVECWVWANHGASAPHFQHMWHCSDMFRSLKLAVAESQAVLNLLWGVLREGPCHCNHWLPRFLLLHPFGWSKTSYPVI